MNKSESREHPSSSAHRHVQHSSTLNRKYVKRPDITPKAMQEEQRAAGMPKIITRSDYQTGSLKRRQAIAEQMNREHLAAAKRGQVATSMQKQAMQKQAMEQQAMQMQARKQAADADMPAQPNPYQAAINRRSQQAKQAGQRMTAKEMKDQAIKQALKSVATMEAQDKKTQAKETKQRTFTGKRIALALGCACIAVVVLAYFVNLNMPNISARVAAMQAGIEASYPSYVPRDYSLANITSEQGKITMTFNNSKDNVSFTLSEEKSSWDSSALEANYAKETWNANYTSIREQGLTIFMSGSDAAWVNGGVLYKIDASANNLTKKQIRTIATSL